LGVFPERGAPRVLWLGIGDGVDELRIVQQVLTVRLSAVAPATRASPGETFTPHLTLARFRDRVHRAHISEITGIPASAGPCLIDRVTLYESRLSPAGPSYLRLAEAPLSRSKAGRNAE
jgi:2'-5' RNA ligase